MSRPAHHHFEELPSTNDKALALAREGAVTGTLVTAERQTAGRGRQGRVWTTPSGSLAMSFVHRPSRALEEVASLTPCVAVGIARALASLGVAPRIKWPNDLLLGKQKVAGILCELHDVTGPAPIVIVGIGLNVDVDAFPDELREIATSLVQHGAAADLARVTEAVSREVRRMLVLHDRGGEVPTEYSDLLVGVGEPITISTGARPSSGDPGDGITGILLGVRHDNGALRIQTPEGERELTSGELLLTGYPAAGQVNGTENMTT